MGIFLTLTFFSFGSLQNFHNNWHFSVLTLTPSFSFSGCLSARGVWGQKGVLAPVGLLRWLALPPLPSTLPLHVTAWYVQLTSRPAWTLWAPFVFYNFNPSVKPGLCLWWCTETLVEFWYLNIRSPDVTSSCWYSMLRGSPCALWWTQSAE